MTFLYIILTVYILAVNFYAFRLIKSQRDDYEAGETTALKTDGKLILAAALGGAPTIYVCMFLMRYRLSNLLLMIAMPLLSVVNFYCFALGYRAIYLFL